MNRIRQLRLERGLTQRQLAGALGVSASSIGMYEQDRREPDREMFLRLADFFGVPVSYLLDGGEPAALLELEDWLERQRFELFARRDLAADGLPLSERERRAAAAALGKGIAAAVRRCRKKEGRG